MGTLPVMVVAAAATQVPKIQKKSFSLSRGAGKRGPFGPKSERRIPVTFFSFFPHLFAPEEDPVVTNARQSREAKSPAC